MMMMMLVVMMLVMMMMKIMMMMMIGAYEIAFEEETCPINWYPTSISYFRSSSPKWLLL